MSSRRSPGEGAVYFEAARGRWVGTIDLGRDPRTGKRRRAKVVAPTAAEVRRRLGDRRKAIEAGDTAPATMTVADLIDQFENAVVPTLTPNNAADVGQHLKSARAGVGAARLTDLRAHDVEAWLKARADAGLSRSTVRRSRHTLARVLRWGQRRDLVARNAADLAELPPTPPPNEGRALDAQELRKLLQATKGTRYEALWWVMAGLGLRPGEARGLRWPDVDLDGAVVHVRHSMKLHDGAHVLGEVKTVKSRRSLTIPAPLVEVLRNHRSRWAEERLVFGAQWPAEWAELVFVTEAGRPYDPNNCHRDLARFAKAAEVGPVRPYDLRHTCATLMAAAGVRLEAIADHLGHTGLVMARTVYVHATAQTVDHAAGPMGDALVGDQGQTA